MNNTTPRITWPEAFVLAGMVAAIAVIATVGGCDSKPTPQPPSANEHSVLVLPPEVEARIAGIEASVAELKKPLNWPTSSPLALDLQEQTRAHQLKLKAMDERTRKLADCVEKSARILEKVVGQIEVLKGQSHEHVEELPCPPKHGAKP